MDSTVMEPAENFSKQTTNDELKDRMEENQLNATKEESNCDNVARDIDKNNLENREIKSLNGKDITSCSSETKSCEVEIMVEEQLDLKNGEKVNEICEADAVLTNDSKTIIEDAEKCSEEPNSPKYATDARLASEAVLLLKNVSTSAENGIENLLESANSSEKESDYVEENKDKDAEEINSCLQEVLKEASQLSDDIASAPITESPSIAPLENVEKMDCDDAVNGISNEELNHLIKSNEVISQDLETKSKDLEANSEKLDDVDILELPKNDNISPTLEQNESNMEEVGNVVTSSKVGSPSTEESLEANGSAAKPDTNQMDSFDVLISDDEMDVSKTTSALSEKELTKQNMSMSIDDDDDVVLLDDTTNEVDSVKSTNVVNEPVSPLNELSPVKDVATKQNQDTNLKTVSSKEDTSKCILPKEALICPLKFMKTIQPSLQGMSRLDLEEFCVVKVVEALASRSALSDLRLKLKAYEKSMEEWRKKVNSLNKQNKDLQIVLKTVCDEQQKKVIDKPTPIKITRSVGLQVGFPGMKNNRLSEQNTNQVQSAVATPPNHEISQTPKPRGRQFKNANASPLPNNNATNIPNVLSKTPKKNSPVPIPRLVPNAALSNSNKNNIQTIATGVSPAPGSNGLLKTALMQVDPKAAEKRPAIQAIDLTDDEPPPAKQVALKTRPNQTQTLRTINPQNANNRVNTYVVNAGNSGPRQVFIPISGQGQPIVNNTNILVPRKMMGNKSPVRAYATPPSQINQNFRIGTFPIRPSNIIYQHPAPLPQSINPKSLMHSAYKWIPPRPSLKIARVENGIVISWEMEDFSESQHEIIASYQIYAYQEASTQPSTDLWKKIGDVKALPLPMACTLTHFMAGFKYYFAVRAIDVHRRVGPFSAPGNILLVSNTKSGK